MIRFLNALFLSLAFLTAPAFGQSLTLLGAGSSGCDPAGTTTYSTIGSQSFVVPNYCSTLQIELWGGGGGGGGNNVGFQSPGTSATASTYVAGSLSAGGGVLGNATFGIGGTASGGTINTNGGNGATGGNGGNSPNGGLGGTFPGSNGNGNPGNPPGGGGSPQRNAVIVSGGGGGGAYVSKTYTPGQLTPASTLTLFVGDKGLGGPGFPGAGGDGAIGQIKITWN